MGLALGVAYDLCRGPRRLWPRLTWVLDLVFGLCLTWALVYFTLVPGDGRLRFFALAAMALGGGLWSGFLSRPFLRCYVACLRAVGTVLGRSSPLDKIFDFFYDNLQKNTFQLGENGLEYYVKRIQRRMRAITRRRFRLCASNARHF